MGRTLLILLLGLSMSFGILAFSRDRRFLDSVDHAVDRYSDYTTKNTSASGAYMALNRLFQNPSWRTGYSNLVLGEDSLAVVIEDNGMDITIAPNQIRIRASSFHTGASELTEVMVFDGSFNEFAVWAKDSVTNVITTDSASGVLDMSLLMDKAPYMPEIDKIGLVNEATTQGHVETGSSFHPSDGYPNGDFYSSGTIPNVTHVQGDLYVHNGNTIYGIFIVEGNVLIDPDGALFGVLYMPNTNSSVNHVGGGIDLGRIRGGVVTWGTMDGGSNIIRVRHWPSYLHALVANFAPNNPSMRVIAWK
jgi:hypothetical protein